VREASRRDQALNATTGAVSTAVNDKTSAALERITAKPPSRTSTMVWGRIGSGRGRTRTSGDAATTRRVPESVGPDPIDERGCTVCDPGIAHCSSLTCLPNRHLEAPGFAP